MFGEHLQGTQLQIASCKGALAESVAEITVGQIILGLHRVFENAAENRKGVTPAPPNMKTLAGSMIGIIGASEVGMRVMNLLKPFSCKIGLYDPFCSQEKAELYGAQKFESLEALCRISDVVSLHVPDLPETYQMMNATLFQAMPDDAIFINTARGRCVDESALIAELSKGRLFAFLDVSHPEPTPAESPFRTLANVVYTSHIAGPPTPLIGRQAVDDIAAFLEGKSPLCVVLPETLGRIA
jgi:phosphoglycerate dehydrogenase-like enzyme